MSPWVAHFIASENLRLLFYGLCQRMSMERVRSTDLEDGLCELFIMQDAEKLRAGGFEIVECFHSKVFHDFEKELYGDLHKFGLHDAKFFGIAHLCQDEKENTM